MHALESEQDADRDNFAWIHVRIASFVDVCQFVVYQTKESNDQFFASHQVVLLSAICFDDGSTIAQPACFFKSPPFN
jgi:hypothetical protein